MYRSLLLQLATLILASLSGGACAPGATAASAANMRAADEWFPQVGDNLTRVNWAHAVNDRAYLDAVLASDVMMIEADIVMGWLVGAETEPASPVMAHPPATISDLSLASFLSSISERNEKLPVDERKGVKLDFKSIEAYEASQILVTPLAGDEMKFPVWLNADILPGPVDADATPVDADRFLVVAKTLPRATLSIGWTTRYGGDTGVTSGAYEQRHADAILSVLRAHSISQPVTFPVRAGLVSSPASQPVLRALLSDTAALLGPQHAATLTVWSSAGDPTDVASLRDYLLEVGLDRVYLDVTPDVADHLHLPAAL